MADLADRKVATKANHKAVLADRTDSSRLTEEEAQKADRVVLQIIKI